MKKFKYQYNKVFQLFSKKTRLRLKFILRHRYIPNLVSPKSFSEKILYRKLNEKNNLYTTCSDKLAVRDYVEKKIGAQYLIPLISCIEKKTYLNLESFGAGIVIKTTHDSGTVFIVNDNSSVDYSTISKGVINSLSTDYGKLYDEFWYSKVPPKVIVEKLLVKSDGGLPEDYKFHVFNNHGDVKVFLQVDYDRFTDHNRSFYDRNGNLLDLSVKYKNYKKKLQNITNLNFMFEIALTLAEPFSYVRVDLYNLDGRIYFGELTFAHGSGLEKFSDKEQDFIWGSYWT